jgi:hypothetical protein
VSCRAKRLLLPHRLADKDVIVRHRIGALSAPAELVFRNQIPNLCLSCFGPLDAVEPFLAPMHLAELETQACGPSLFCDAQAHDPARRKLPGMAANGMHSRNKKVASSPFVGGKTAS